MTPAPLCYQVRVAEPLESRWEQWLGAEVEIAPAGEGALLTAALPDQAALFALLTRLRDLNLTLLEVKRLDQK